MSNDGIFRAKYKKIPPQQKQAKSTTNAAVAGKSGMGESSRNLKSIMKASAPHLTCYNSKSDSKKSLRSTNSSISNIKGSQIDMTDENGNLGLNLLKYESSEFLSINTLNAVQSRTDFGTSSKVNLNAGICIKNPVVSSNSMYKSSVRSKSLNGLPRKINEDLFGKSSEKKEAQSNYKSIDSNEESESIVRELESKLKSTGSRGHSKLKRSKSVKFNLESERTAAGVNSQPPQQQQRAENLETAIPFAANGIPNGLPAHVHHESTIADFLSSLLPLSWSAHVNLNPIPAITRSSTGFLIAAYDLGAQIVRTGIQMAHSFLSDGIAITEPREDIIQYNGFTIRTFGRELLLQSLYINYEQRDVRPRTHNRRRPSSASSSASSIASCPSCNCIFSSRETDNATGNLKMRIVIEVTAMPNSNRAEHSYLTNGETRVVCEGSRWSLIYGSMMEGLVEIEVPDTTRAENIIFRGPIDGIIIIDIP